MSLKELGDLMNSVIPIVTVITIITGMIGWLINHGRRMAAFDAAHKESLKQIEQDAKESIAEQTERLARMEVKIDTLWDFQIRRGIAEVVERGVGSVNSPLVISEEAKQWMQELAGPLQSFYRAVGRNLSDRDLAVEIEVRFGKEIVDKVCIPQGINQGACLVIAMDVAKSGVNRRQGDPDPSTEIV